MEGYCDCAATWLFCRQYTHRVEHRELVCALENDHLDDRAKIWIRHWTQRVASDHHTSSRAHAPTQIAVVGVFFAVWASSQVVLSNNQGSKDDQPSCHKNISETDPVGTELRWFCSASTAQVTQMSVILHRFAKCLKAQFIPLIIYKITWRLSKFLNSIYFRESIIVDDRLSTKTTIVTVHYKILHMWCAIGFDI